MKAMKKKKEKEKEKVESESEMEIEQHAVDQEDEQVNHPISELIVNNIFI